MVILKSSPTGRRIGGGFGYLVDQLNLVTGVTWAHNLTDDQRACLAEEERRYLAAKNKVERGKQTHGAGPGRGIKTDAVTSTATVSRDRSKDSRTQVAKQHQVSEHKVRLAGKSTREIAKAVGVDHKTVCNSLSSGDNSPLDISPPDKPKRLTRETKAAIAKALEGGEKIEAAECGEDVAELRCVTKAAVNEWKRSSEVLGIIEDKVKLTLLESFQPTHASEIAKHFRKLAGKADGWGEETPLELSSPKSESTILADGDQHLKLLPLRRGNIAITKHTSNLREVYLRDRTKKVHDLVGDVITTKRRGGIVYRLKRILHALEFAVSHCGTLLTAYSHASYCS